MELPPVHRRRLIRWLPCLEVDDAVAAIIEIHDDVEPTANEAPVGSVREPDGLRLHPLLPVLDHAGWEVSAELLRPPASEVGVLQCPDLAEHLREPDRGSLNVVLHLEDEAAPAVLVRVGDVRGGELVVHGSSEKPVAAAGL